MAEGFDRRDMLVGAGALTLAATAAIQAAKPQGRKVGYAIVGLGLYGAGIIMPRFADCRYSRLTALVSGDPAKARDLARKYGVPERSIYDYRTFDRIRDNPDVDVVYVVLPNSMHAEYAIRAAQAGKHVLCEKPMANSVAECEAMIAACRKAGRKLMIGYRSHFEPYNMHAMRLRRDGAIGKLRFVESEHGWTQGDPSRWRLKRALSGGGSLMDIGIYSVQAMRYLSAEEPITVTARESTDRSDPRFTEVEDMIHWTFEFPSGAIGGGLTSYSSNHNHSRATGTDGWIDMDPSTRYEGNRLRLRRGSSEEDVAAPSAPWPNQFAGQLDHMAQCVLTGSDPIVGGEEGLRDMRIIEAIYRSAAESRTIDLRT
jgi:glucose-fructose oxidoreductase